MSDRPALARYPGSIPGGPMRRTTHWQRSQAMMTTQLTIDELEHCTTLEPAGGWL